MIKVTVGDQNITQVLRLQAKRSNGGFYFISITWHAGVNQGEVSTCQQIAVRPPWNNTKNAISYFF
jgi:hypothetical protein